MKTLYRKVAVSDLEKLMEDSLTTKKRGGEYRTALSHVLNISEVPDNEADLRKENEEMRQLLIRVNLACNINLTIEKGSNFHLEIEELLNNHK